MGKPRSAIQSAYQTLGQHQRQQHQYRHSECQLCSREVGRNSESEPLRARGQNPSKDNSLALAAYTNALGKLEFQPVA